MYKGTTVKLADEFLSETKGTRETEGQIQSAERKKPVNQEFYIMQNYQSKMKVIVPLMDLVWKCAAY